MRITGEISPLNTVIRGWLFDEMSPLKRLHVTLAVNGEVVENCRAWRYRGQARKKGSHRTGFCGFQFRYPLQRLRDGDVVDVFETSSGTRIGGAPFIFTSKQIFFMHIAKTAGSALNAYMVNRTGAQNAYVHIEAMVSNTAKMRRCQKKAFVSGHVRYKDASQLLDLSRFYRVTLLREPYSHLISNLAWTKRLSEERSKELLLEKSERFQRVVRRLGNMDFSDLNQLEAFVSGLSPLEIQLFDNYQTRFCMPVVVGERLTEAHLQSARDTLNQFDLIGTNDRFELFLQRLCDHLGWPFRATDLERKNVHSERFGLPVESDELRRILRPLYEVDEKLYQSAVEWSPRTR
ncbi:MAG: sulfotransferase family 2 domain-containing protein [Deltaproteobacteria bacterium]|nr:sulfotransferase family 2 domain-containing protein [Deltaproteobacteria bacterium]